MRLGHALSALLVVAGCGAQRTSTHGPGEGASAGASPDATRADGGAGTAAAVGTAASGMAAPSASTSPGPGSGEAPVSVATSKAHADGRHYALDARAPGTVSLGGRGELDIVLVAKDGYHINDEYPYKLKTSSNPPGVVTFDAPELSRSQGTYTKTEGRFQAKFIGARAGVAKIGGTMSLSVCTKKECIIDRIELEVPVTVR